MSGARQTARRTDFAPAAILHMRGALMRLAGWRRAFAAILFGVAATAALPPVYVLPLVVVAFTGLLWLLEGTPNVRAAAWTGWWFGLGHFTTGIYWVALALLTDPERYGWMAPFAPLGLAAYLAIYPALAAGAAKYAERAGLAKSGLERVVAFAVAWTAAEWLRGHLLTGFPWNPIGSVWSIATPMMQFASLAGVYGLGFITVIAAAVPSLLGEERRRAYWSIGGVAFVLAAIGAGGAIRLATGSPDADVPDTILRIAQPNIAQTEKWREELRIAHLKRDLDLTRQAAARAPEQGGQSVFVIWPETAVPFLLEQEPEVRAAIASVVPKNGLVITGAPRATPPDAQPFRVWNGLVAVNAEGAIMAHSNKFHLVPFGEYLPLRDIVGGRLGLSKLTPGTIDFSAGPGPQTLHLPGLPPVSPLICYEIIFPHAVANEADPPGLFINVTNDAWFGTSSGPYQHFESARMRAIEEGVPVARAANTGISGVIDPYGRVIARIALNQDGTIDSPLPKSLAQKPLYARYGDGMLLALVLAGGMVAAAIRRLLPAAVIIAA